MRAATTVSSDTIRVIPESPPFLVRFNMADTTSNSNLK
jgi:hypothetical protein